MSFHTFYIKLHLLISFRKIEFDEIFLIENETNYFAFNELKNPLTRHFYSFWTRRFEFPYPVVPISSTKRQPNGLYQPKDHVVWLVRFFIIYLRDRARLTHFLSKVNLLF